jgi:hypothetical protein
MDTLKLKPFPNVAANAQFSLSTDELKGPYTLFGLQFEMGGTTFTKSHISDLNIRAGGKDLLSNITGSRLVSLNLYDGFPDDTNYLYHFFGDPAARTIRGQWLGGLDMSIYGNDPLEIRGTIGAATAPTLAVRALVGPPKLSMGIDFSPAEAAVVRAMMYTLVQPAAAVSRQAQSIGLGSEAGARLRRLSFFHTNLTSVEFRKAGDIKHDDINVAGNASISNQFARDPQSGLYILDRVVDGNAGMADTTLKNDGSPWPFQVRITTSASDTIPVYADVHAPIPLL